MSDWTDIGLPLPQRQGYGYALDPGLTSTSFATSHRRIKSTWKSTRRNFSISFLLTQAQLSLATTFLRTYGYTWFTIPLYSGLGTDVQDHTVRATDSFKVDVVGKNYLRLTIPLETQLTIDAPDLTSITCLDPIPCTPAEADEV